MKALKNLYWKGCVQIENEMPPENLLKLYIENIEDNRIYLSDGQGSLYFLTNCCAIKKLSNSVPTLSRIYNNREKPIYNRDYLISNGKEDISFKNTIWSREDILSFKSLDDIIQQYENNLKENW